VSRPGISSRALLHGAAALAFVALAFYLTILQLGHRRDWALVWQNRAAYAHGWLLTVGVSLVALGLSTALGLLVALMRQGGVLFVRYVATIYVELVRGTPLLVQILLLFYGVFGRAGSGDPLVAGVIILSLFGAAHISEFIRAGIESVGISQLENARMIGLTKSQTLWHVVLPQAFGHAGPLIAGQFSVLAQASSLLSVIAINEFTSATRPWNGGPADAPELFLPLVLGYLLLTVPISRWSESLQRRHKAH
jgi:polar amino acid transport system permease protein